MKDKDIKIDMIMQEMEAEAIKGNQEVIDNLSNGKIYDGKDPIFDEIMKDGNIDKMIELIKKV